MSEPSQIISSIAFATTGMSFAIAGIAIALKPAKYLNLAEKALMWYPFREHFLSQGHVSIYAVRNFGVLLTVLGVIIISAGLYLY